MDFTAAEDQLLCASFNQNCTALAVGDRRGVRLFALDSPDKLEPAGASGVERDVCIVERLFASCLLALVSVAAPSRLQIRHLKKDKEICCHNYPSAILSVRLNRQYLIVCLAESIHIHSMRDMKVKHIIQETPFNASGSCALSVGENESYLAYPGSSSSGVVNVFDVLRLKSVTSVNAHTSPLAAIAISMHGDKLVTASEKGTVIRVFSLPDGTKLFDFRRGLKRCVAVSSLAFSADSLYVAVSSNTETVHVFKLLPNEESSAATGSGDSSSSLVATQGWATYVTQALLKTSVPYLPTQIADALGSSRSFATARLPKADLKSACCITSIRKSPHLFVASLDGVLHVYTFDSNVGGECTLVRQHRLVDGNRQLLLPNGLSGGASGVTSANAPSMQSMPITDVAANQWQGRSDNRILVGAPNGSITASCRGDASYAYKLKKVPGSLPPATVSQELNEIVDNVPGNLQDISIKQAGTSLQKGTNVVTAAALPLDDFNEFPPVS